MVTVVGGIEMAHGLKGRHRAAPPVAGQVFGLLTTTGNATRHNDRVYWECKCECGQVKFVQPGNLQRTSRSCGCQKGNRKHGHATGTISPTYSVWRSMIQRCTNPKEQAFKHYGARGITVCAEWMKFENFLRDMGERPAGTEIDRKNNSLGYCKENCRWADRFTQARNRDYTKLSPDSVRDILRRFEAGEALTSIAASFGVVPTTIGNVVHGRTWQDIKKESE